MGRFDKPKEMLKNEAKEWLKLGIIFAIGSVVLFAAVICCNVMSGPIPIPFF